MVIMRWFLSRTVRSATDFARQVRGVLNEQRDLLSGEAIAAVEAAVAELRAGLRAGIGEDEIHNQVHRLEQIATQHLKSYPHPGARENVKEILVAVTVILSITSFFVQLTKIPTGSLQPTLFGITYQDLNRDPEAEIPGRLRRFYEYWVHGVSFFHVVAESDGPLRRIEDPKTLFPFVRRQRIIIGESSQSIWFPPDDLFSRAGIVEGRYFHKGDSVIKMKVVAGDHLLVDRLSYNFRHPRRGEIIVFKTKGIEGLQQDLLYIKRLVALPGERVRIGNDSHLIIDGQRLDASTPHFENVYTFDDGPRLDHYSGHVNGAVGRLYGHPNLARLFPDETSEYRVGKDHFMVMGDNTLNSLDSRSWGDLPQQNVTGKAFFVYWPISDRFGWAIR